MNLFSEYSPPMTVAKAIRMSWASLADTPVLVRLILPVILALVFCFAILIWGWPIVTGSFVPYLQTFSFLQSTFNQIDAWLGFSLLNFFSLFIFTILIFMATYFILIVLTSIILVPLLNPVIKKLYFPHLTENSELTFLTSMRNSIAAIAIYFALFLILLPAFLFIPGGQILVPFFLNAYLAKRVFPYDVLQDYATSAEFDRFILKEKKSLWTLALLTGGYFYVPVLNLLAAPLSALAFVIFSMGKISEYRR